MDYIDTIINGDNIEAMAGLPMKSIPLIITDPPYNIGKAAWDKIDNYLDWCGEWLKACERVLADNGSMYVFHNDKEFIADLMIWIRENTGFVFKNEIVWNKRFDGMRGGLFNWRIFNNGFRHYTQMAEYILFYTFQDETGLSRIYDDRDCFRGIKDYMRAEQQATGLNTKSLEGILGTQMTGHYFSDSQWCLPTAEMYTKLQTTGFFQRPYEELRMEYEELRMEYEELRYTFNNQKTHHSVWNYETVRNAQHPTQKPVDLIENIILHSSNEGDVVLDPFSGSGTTAVAAIRTGRHYIGIDTDAGYCEIAERRIAETYQEIEDKARQIDMFAEAAGD